MKKTLTIVSLILIVATTLNAQRRKNKSKYFEEDPKYYSITYSLPRTVLIFKITAEETTQLKGPFSEYAENYMMMENYIKRNSSNWKITKIEMDYYNEMDPEEFHQAKLASNHKSQIKDLFKKGIIRNTNSELVSLNANQKFKNLNYSDISVVRHYKQRKDTIIKVVETNNTFIKVPEMVRVFENKGEDEIVKEAVHQIYKLRKRRFKILACDYKQLPQDGESYKTIVTELNKLEKEYIALFKGKTIKKEHSIYVAYVPEQSAAAEKLFSFSNREGFSNSSNAKPVTIKIKDLVTKKITTDTVQGIKYRIPHLANIELIFNKNILYNTRFPIQQYGHYNTIPYFMLKEKNKDIILNK